MGCWGLALMCWLLTSAAWARTNSSHWAFQPVRPVPIPSVEGRVQTPVDAFILTRLAHERLTPNPLADRRTLIRRATIDLTGLPPDPDVVDAFVEDSSPDAVRRIVDRLLESPEYGERWARWWLDLARYADTNGQDENKVMANAWRYRDWVVEAFNSDKPYDQFIHEQLAGDLMPTNGLNERAVFDRWVATGFLVLGPKMLAEQDKPKLVMDLVDEQIDTVGRAFLGLTVSCSRCHDHKFDPIPTTDYYALAGIFKSTRAMENLDFVSKFNERWISTAAELARIAAHETGLKERTARVDALVKEANTALVGTWKQQLPRAIATTLGLESATNQLDAALLKRTQDWLNGEARTNGLATLARELISQPDSALQKLAALEQAPSGVRLGAGRLGTALVCDGSNSVEVPHRPELEPAQFTLETWVQLDETPKGGESRRWLVSKNGNEWVDGHYALFLEGRIPAAYLNVTGGRGGEISIRAVDRTLKKGEWSHLAMTFDERELRLYVNGTLAAEQRVGRARLPGKGPFALGKRQDGHVYFRGLLDETRLWNRALSADQLRKHYELPTAEDATGAVAVWNFDASTPEERVAVVRSQFREALYGKRGLLVVPDDPRPLWPVTTRDAVARLESERDAWKATAPPPTAVALAVAEDNLQELPVHIRGNHLNLAPTPVPRGFLQVLLREPQGKLPETQSGRLELARWLASSDNPLTARVVVNRVWQAHFGEGLVRTPDNFGVRGDPPTHPELLDWLAGEFMRSGWSFKHLHRIILNSATWQTDSVLPAGSPVATMDPDNRWLSRFPRQRLEAEMVRDAMLTVSRRLDRTRGGTLVSWKNNEYTPADDVSAKSHRRSIYLPLVRDRMFDLFTIFDGANPSVGTARRVPTVVSHQALFFMNSPLVKSAAHAVAEAVCREEAADVSHRVSLVYRQILQRRASVRETERAAQFLQQAESMISNKSKIDVWASFCQTLIASNEFLYRD